MEFLASYKNTKSISLGSNILRAETAAITAIAQVKLLDRHCEEKLQVLTKQSSKKF
ncbi:MAG: hypothetical protein LN589_02900 [Rickettsia endosymbiont of Eriopis connexa]|nr:hypothetical protein [Rickettsia endosymbiont of Eriopis connexa]